MPVVIGIAFAAKDALLSGAAGDGSGGFSVAAAVLCLLFAFLMQIDSNFINDYFDFVHGNDDRATRLGPKRACAEGWITPRAMRIGIALTTAVACAVGMPLVMYGGWWMVAVGAVCVLFAFLYTTVFSYLGLGDVLVLLFFGIVPVCFTYYLSVPASMQGFTPEVVAASVGCGFVIDTLLCINNFRDREGDRRDGKLTLMVRLGERRGAKLYFLTGAFGALLTMAAVMLSAESLTGVALCWLPYIVYFVLHRQAYRRLLSVWQGRELNKVLGLTSRDMSVYGLATVVAVLIAMM